MQIQSSPISPIKQNKIVSEKPNAVSVRTDNSVVSYDAIPTLAFKGLFGIFKNKSQIKEIIKAPKFQPCGDIEGFSKYNKFFNEQHPVEVAQGVYRGGRPKSPLGIIALKRLGIKKIISFDRREHQDLISSWQDEKKLAEKYGIEFIHLPWNEKKPPSKEYIDMFLDECKDAKEKPVYFHCSAGQDRAGTMGALYDIDVQGMKYDEAYSRMISQGHDFKAFPHLDGFIYNHCLEKGENPKDMHPKEVLNNLFYSNRWVRYIDEDYVKNSLVDHIVFKIKNPELDIDI